MKKKSAAVLLTCFGLMTTTPAMNPEASDAGAQFRALADHYFSDVVFHFGPTNATQIGFHQYDTKLEDYSRAGVESEIAALRGYEQKFDSFPAAGLDESTQGDLAIMRDNIRGNLLELETIRGWEKNPDNYSSGITNSAFVLMERDFAPADERLRSLIAREKQMPAVFAAARQNLKNPPRIYTEIALEQLPDIISFFQHDVPDAFKGAKDPATTAEFRKTNGAVIAALESYQGWLKSDLLPRSNGDFRIGADTFSKKLLYDEMVDMPLDRLLQIGYDDLHKNQAEFTRIAKEVDPAQNAEGSAGRTCRHSSASGSAAPDLSRHLQQPDRIYSGEEDHHHPLDRAADAGRDAAVYARDHPGLDGFAGAVREAFIDGVLQRDAAGEELAAANASPTTWRRSTWAPSSAPPSTRRIPATTCSSCG